MTEKYQEGNCFICENFFRILHWHHTVPQALGGAESLQIPLCGSCHTILHAQADFIVAYKNGSKVKAKQFWANEVQERNASQYLEILVAALMRAEHTLPVDKLYKLPVPLTCRIHAALKLFRTDNAHGSLPNAILYCIKYTLQQQGYLIDEHDDPKPHRSDNPSRPKNHLW